MKTVYQDYKFTPNSLKWRNKKSNNFRKRLIKCSTVSEDILYKELLNVFKGKCDIIRQKVINTPKSFYIADFFLKKYKIIIEVDGEYHNTEAQIILDKDREHHILIDQIRKGYKIIRFSNEEIKTNLSNVINKIQEFIELPKIIKI